MTDPYGRRGRTSYDGAGSRLPSPYHRRLARLGIGRIHPACKAAFTDGATPCGRCQWLLGMDTEPAAYIDAHVDDGEDI
jgi:hypothetical protein